MIHLNGSIFGRYRVMAFHWKALTFLRNADLFFKHMPTKKPCRKDTVFEFF
jgi:hypothetical protein